MMNTHSPFEPGYIGNSDSGVVGVLDVTFPRARLAAAGAPDEVLDLMATHFTDELDEQGRLEAVRLIDSLEDDVLLDFVREAVDETARRTAYGELTPQDRGALAALSEDERATLAALSEDQRAELTVYAAHVEDVQAVAALSEQERAELDALSAEEWNALAGLSQDKLDALAADARREAREDQSAEVADHGEEHEEQLADAVGDVPAGKVPDVLAWVNGDRGRAETALAVEENSDRPRQTLIVALEQLLNAGPPTE